MEMIKTLEGTLRSLLDLAGGEFQTVCHMLFAQFTSAELVGVLGLDSAPGSDDLRKQALGLAKVMWVFVVRLVGALALTRCKYLVPPRSFVGLLSGSPDQVNDAVASLKANCLSV
eukprot:9584197-Alexandrium_andersonii.AAC.1